ncbi:MAG: hypothetical protein QOD55_1487 [Solirubrobacteraceae bacterium]|nr:hypothetical protein [Solirubrobacteraceae bacterium]
MLVPAPRLQGRRRRRARWVGALTGLVAAVIVAVVVAGLQADRRERDRAEAARTAAAERARLTRLQAPHRGAATGLRPRAGAGRAQRLAARAALVRRVEAEITADARARDRAGELDGPIGATECGPFLRGPDAVPDDRVLAKRVGRYDCVAVKADIRRDGTSVGRLGYPFVAAVDFARFTFVWCRNTPPPSERGQALGFVRLDRACLAAKGPPVGTGYADVPGS